MQTVHLIATIATLALIALISGLLFCAAILNAVRPEPRPQSVPARHEPPPWMKELNRKRGGRAA